MVISALRGRVDSPVWVRVLGGELRVSFERHGDEADALFLGGGTRFVVEGAVYPEAWEWGGTGVATASAGRSPPTSPA